MRDQKYDTLLTKQNWFNFIVHMLYGALVVTLWTCYGAL